MHPPVAIQTVIEKPEPEKRSQRRIEALAAIEMEEGRIARDWWQSLEPWKKEQAIQTAEEYHKMGRGRLNARLIWIGNGRPGNEFTDGDEGFCY